MDIIEKIDKLEEMMNKKQLAMLAGVSSRQDKKAKKFKKGDTVTHRKHGKGKIISINPSHACTFLLNVYFGNKTIELPSHEFKEGQ